MSLFKRKREPPPDWSPFENPDDWLAFEKVVRTEAGSRGMTGDVREGILVDGNGYQYGLTNIAQMCGETQQGEWPGLVKHHFDLCLASVEHGDFDNRGEARVALRARLLNDEFFSGFEHDPVARRVAEDLQIVLAFDLPDRVMIASREDVLQWGPEDELFELAIEQTRAERGLELERIELDDGQEVLALSGDSFFTSTHALWAHELDPPESDHGTLIAIPNRHLIFAYAIRDVSVLGVINHMIQLAVDWEAKGPGSVSRHLYWLHDDELERLPVLLEDGAIVFQPSEGFTGLLNELA